MRKRGKLEEPSITHRGCSAAQHLTEGVASSSEIIEYSMSRAGMMDTTTCYWCEKNCMSCNLMLCQSCRKVSYCGKKCQIRGMFRSSASHGRCRKTRDSVSPRLANLECQTPPGCKANGMIEARVEVKKATKPVLHGKRKE
jgi:hypothetical protein